MLEIINEYPILWEWMAFAFRWLHVITAIAWIGSSFYFIALDLGLRKHSDLVKGAHGDEWQVHGGGFYHIQKYLVAPANLPEHLTWFKWESYATWLSGFAMLCVVYYAQAGLFLIDPNVLDIHPGVGILISLVSLAAGWLIYDLLCKSPFGKNATALMVLFYLIIVVISWGYTQLFTGRAALLHLGALTATIMSANVFLIIIPNQKKVVADLIAGKNPNPALGMQSKQRSVHNNYLTLPVLFLMLSNHYPLAFATQYNWLIASLVFLMGVTIRYYFNMKHARQGDLMWLWIPTGIIFLLIILLSMVPLKTNEADEVALSSQLSRFSSHAQFSKVRDAVIGRCSMCHAKEPSWEGIVVPPRGVVLETDADIAKRARQIYLHAGRTNAMPPANVSFMELEERQLITDWYEAVVSKPKL